MKGEFKEEMVGEPPMKRQRVEIDVEYHITKHCWKG